VAAFFIIATFLALSGLVSVALAGAALAVVLRLMSVREQQ